MTFTEFGDPAIDRLGRVAFWALYSGAQAKGSGGLYVYNGTALVRVVDDDPASAGVVPDRSGADYFGRFARTASFNPLTQPLAWGGGDRLLFNSEVDGANRSRGIYRWRASDGSIVRVVDREQLAALYPNTSPNIFLGNFFSPAVSDEGLASFITSYTYFTNPPNPQVISGTGAFLSTGAALNVIGDVRLSSTAGAVPDQPPAARFVRIDSLATMSAAGEFLFQAEYRTGNGSQGVYLRTGASTVRVIDSRSAASWPGLPLGTWVNPPESREPDDTSEPFEALAIGPSGDIAIETTLAAGAAATRECVLLFRRSTGTWTELAGPGGTPATSLLTGVNSEGGVVVLSEGRPLLMTATTATRLDDTTPAGLFGVAIRWLNNLGALNNAGRAALRFQRDPDQAAGPPGIAYWNGQRLLIVADAGANNPVAGITTIGTLAGPEFDRPGRSGWLNDRDEVVFRIEKSDASQAVYIARGN